MAPMTARAPRSYGWHDQRRRVEDRTCPTRRVYGSDLWHVTSDRHPPRRRLAQQRSASEGGFVGQALPLGLFEGGVLDEKALPFVAFASAAEAHDHGGQAAGLIGAAGQRGVDGG